MGSAGAKPVNIYPRCIGCKSRVPARSFLMEETLKSAKAKKSSVKTLQIVQLGVLIAIMAVLEFTGIGIIPLGFGVEITIMMIPVIIGGVVLGKWGGAVLGGVFGLLSFWECFGKSAFGTFLFGLNPVYTFIICVAARVLAGFFAGLAFEGFRKVDKTKLWSYGAAALVGSLANTILFVGLLVLLFWGGEEFTATMSEWGMPVGSFWAYAGAIVGVNGVIEAVFNTIVGSAIGKAVAAVTQLVNKD